MPFADYGRRIVKEKKMNDLQKSILKLRLGRISDTLVAVYMITKQINNRGMKSIRTLIDYMQDEIDLIETENNLTGE